MLRRIARETAGWLVRYTGVYALTRRTTRRGGFTILVYHDPTPEELSAHLRFLAPRHTFVSLPECVAALTEGRLRDLPPNALAITLDDGHKGNHALLPIFKDFSVRPMIYLCSHVVNTHRKFWWRAPCRRHPQAKRLPYTELLAYLEAECGHTPDKEYEERLALNLGELRAMQPYVDFGAHTCFHPVLTNCDDATCEAEIAESKPALEALLGMEFPHFAYPNGDYGPRERAIVERCGFVSARTTQPGRNRAGANPLALRAIVVMDEDSVNALCGRVSGVLGVLRGLFDGTR